MNKTFVAFRKVFSGAAWVAVALALFANPLYAAKTTQSAEPGKDHPLVGRYEGSVLTLQQPAKFPNLLKRSLR
jgi:hypothetical protein